MVDVKAGKGHALALTVDGQVFAWGINGQGQVGKGGPIKREDVVWEPTRVYPVIKGPKNMQPLEEDLDFDPAVQIVAYEKSSFLLTLEGEIYSWGKNEFNFLGRESKIDVGLMKPKQAGDQGLMFSNSAPAKVQKLEDYKISRIAIRDGKFMAFLVGDVRSKSMIESKVIEQNKPEDSEVDPEEEKDVVAESVGKFVKRVEDSAASIQRESMASRASVVSGSAGIIDRRQAKADKDLQRKYQSLSLALKKAADIKEELSSFDKQLADIMKPFTDLRELSEGGTLYGPVLDKFVSGKQNRVDADELRMAIDRLQLQLKA